MSVDAKQRTLTDDGFSEEFFHMLQTRDEVNFNPNINIPDTIVFKYGQPTQWFFTSSNGRIRKKNKNNLLNARIEECFNKYILGYDVIASFVTMPEANPETGEFPISEVEYLDRKGLNELLYLRKKNYSGILQRFIEPSGIHNEMIRAIWSPKICILERAENVHEIHSERYGIYERCVTFEGPAYYYRTTPLRGPVLSGQIQKICEEIAAHIPAVTYGQKIVNRMVLDFKVDSRDTIFLCNSTSIRIIDMNTAVDPRLKASGKIKRELVNIDNVFTLPNSVNLNPMPSHSGVRPKKRIICLSCAKESLEDLRYPVTYKSVIKHYEHILHLCTVVNGKDKWSKAGRETTKQVIAWPPQDDIIQSGGGVGFGCLKINADEGDVKIKKIDLSNPLEAAELRIPPILRMLHSKMTASQYGDSAKDPLFLYKTLAVCESCYLVYAEFTTMLLRLGQDLKKLLEPDPQAVEAIKQAKESNRGSRENLLNESSFGRPSSADWKAMSQSVSRSTSALGSINKPGHLRASTNHKHARDNAIGLRSDDTAVQPGMPSRVARAGDFNRTAHSAGGVGFNQYSNNYNSNPDLNPNSLQQNSVMSWMTGNDQAGMGSIVLGSPSIVGGNYGASMMSNSMSFGPFEGHHQQLGVANDENVNNFNKMSYTESVQSMIKDRELHFFKEVSRNPQLKDQHPLMHLIASQNKLQLADESAGIIATKEAMRKENVFGKKYGKQSSDKHDQYGVYNVELPYIMQGKIILPSVLRQQKEDFKKAQREMIEERKQKRLSRRRADSTISPAIDLSILTTDPSNGTRTSADDINNEDSAANHRAFLKDALTHIEVEMMDATKKS